MAEARFGSGRVVDAHHHLWNIAENPYPWLSEAPPGSAAATLAERDGHYEAPAYRDDVARWNVVASVHVQGEWDRRDPVGETRWLQAQQERHGWPSAIVGWARLEADDARETLLAHAEHPAFRGIRQMLDWDDDVPAPRDRFADRAWRRGFALLAPLGLSFDLQTHPAEMPDAAALAAAHPETSIVLCHAGSPDEAGDDRALWREGMRRLADCENVTVKLSGITQPRRSVEQVQEYVEEVLAAFGCERAMFGTNLPVEHLDGSVQVLADAIERVLANRSDAERDAVWGATAARVYRLIDDPADSTASA